MGFQIIIITFSKDLLISFFKVCLNFGLNNSKIRFIYPNPPAFDVSGLSRPQESLIFLDTDDCLTVYFFCG